MTMKRMAIYYQLSQVFCRECELIDNFPLGLMHSMAHQGDDDDDDDDVACSRCLFSRN